MNEVRTGHLGDLTSVTQGHHQPLTVAHVELANVVGLSVNWGSAWRNTLYTRPNARSRSHTTRSGYVCSVAKTLSTVTQGCGPSRVEFAFTWGVAGLNVVLIRPICGRCEAASTSCFT